MALEPFIPAPCVVVGGEDLTDLIEMDSLQRSMTERGEAAASWDMLVTTENEVVSNALVRDASVVITLLGTDRWVGHVVNVQKPDASDLVMTVQCAGEWDVLHHDGHYRKGFIDTSYDNIVLYPSNWFSSGTQVDSVTFDTTGQVLFTLPVGQDIKDLQGQLAHYWLMNGLAPDACIKRVTGTVTCSGSGAFDWGINAQAGTPYAVTQLDNFINGTSTPADSQTFDATLPTGFTWQVLQFYFKAASDISGLTAEESVQFTDLNVYVDCTSAPTVDDAAAAIYTDVTGDSGTTTETIGSALEQLMFDADAMAADDIQAVLALADTPPLCGVIHGKFYCKSRPTSPPDNSRLWVVSYELTPGLQWGAQVDDTASCDYVCVRYLAASDASVPVGTPQTAYYPSTPSDATSRIVSVDTSLQMSATRAGLVAQQTYAWNHGLTQGSVIIPYQVHNGYGQLGSVDDIECWDWIMNVGKVDPALAGPFLISEVTHQGWPSVATITLGSFTGYIFQAAATGPVSPGRYIGAHRQRVRYQKKVAFSTYWHWKNRAYYKKHHKYPQMPAHHAKQHTMPAYKWVDVAGAYT